MPLKYIPGVRSVTLTALRRRRGWTEKDLADRARISVSMVTWYETEQEPSHEKLYELATLMGYEAEDVDALLFALSRADRPLPDAGSPVDPSPSAFRRIRQIAGRAGRAVTELLEARLLHVARAWRVRKARRQAGRLWREIEKTPPPRRRALLETSRKFQTWAVAERLANESEKAASDKADLALELALLGFRAAELAPGDQSFMAPVQGYALILVANARRVANQMRKAGEDCDRALDLWKAGAPEARKILPAWRVLDREGSLRRDQRRFPEALERLKEARAIAPPKAVARILVNRAVVLEHMGDVEQAIEVLREAEAHERQWPDSALRLKIPFNLAVNLCHLDLYADAEQLLPGIRELAVTGRGELDLLRVLWLSGRVDAGFGRLSEARGAFDQVRRELEAREMAYDYALVSMERAEIDLREGRRAEVRALAEEMRWIFKAQGIHREALAALALFRRAAAEERATQELARRLVQYLYRAQYDPELRFEA
jgi:transcriptional regulator with XRE-family HTH domain